MTTDPTIEADVLEEVAKAVYFAEWANGHAPVASWEATAAEEPDSAEAYRVLARAAITAYLTTKPSQQSQPPAADEVEADSGMDGDSITRAEWFWANLPTGNRKWTSLDTHEKALVCHTIARFSTLRSQQSSEVELREAAQKVLAWWDDKLANELSSNRDFAWAEDAEFDQFQDLRTALARSQGEGQ